MGEWIADYLGRLVRMLVYCGGPFLLILGALFALEWRVTGLERAAKSALELALLVGPIGLGLLTVIALISGGGAGSASNNHASSWSGNAAADDDYHNSYSARHGRGESGQANQWAPSGSPDRRLWESDPGNGHTGVANPNAPSWTPDRQSWENQYGQNSW